MYRFAFLLNNAGPNAYRIVREVLTFPSVTAIRTHWLRATGNPCGRVEGNRDDCDVPELLNGYREYWAIPSGFMQQA
jgi:hypothetical protein